MTAAFDTAPVRFERKLDRAGAIPTYRPDLGRCWLWLGTLVDGYGLLRVSARRQVKAHRYSYELLVGPIPAGFEIDHLCRVTRCVRPSHLEAVTPRENTLRSDSVGGLNARRTACPLGHPYSPENTLYERGRRRCAICRRASNREAMARHRARKARAAA